MKNLVDKLWILPLWAGILAMAACTSSGPAIKNPVYVGPENPDDIVFEINLGDKPLDGDLSYTNIGNTTELGVYCNWDWETKIVLSSGEVVDWAVLDVEYGDAGYETITNLIVGLNDTEQDRVAALVFTAGKFEAGRIIINQGGSDLEVSDASVMFTYPSGSTKDIAVSTNLPGGWEYSAEPAQNDWLEIRKTGTGLSLKTLSANESEEDERVVKITVTAGDIRRTVDIVQDMFRGSYVDGQVVLLEQATAGKGINLVFMGDGYTAGDMIMKNGKYEQTMRLSADHFFSIYPYSDYREWFNVWMVAAVSNEEGVSIGTSWERPSKRVDTKLSVTWEGGRSTGLQCNSELVMELASLVAREAGLQVADNYTYDMNYEIPWLKEITVVIPVNADIYAGTCYMPTWGFSFSMNPTGDEYGADQYQKVTIHEVGGHGFGKLLDEYYIGYGYENTTMPNYMRRQVIEAKALGMYANVDVNNESGDDIAQNGISDTSWAAFEGLPGYELVGAWEGSWYYGRGVWRPEFNSCMNDNVLYFNAPSRYAQIARIHKWGGDTDYTFEEFIAEDKRPAYPTETRGRVSMPPLGPPVIFPAR